MNGVVLNENLSRFTELGIYASMAFYAVAFFLLSMNLARAASEKALVRKQAPKLETAGIWLIVVGALFQAIGVVGRGVAVGRVPWANMYEFTITSTLVAVVIFAIAQFVKKEIRFVGVLLSGFVTLALGIATTLWYVQVKTLMPALQNYWLYIHVSLAIVGTGFFNIAAAMSIAYLLKSAKWVTEPKPALAGNALFKLFKRILDLFPGLEQLEQTSYRFNIIGVILWTFTLLAGAVWAERAWHRFWGWDTKEVWTFIIWMIYAGYLHAKATRGWSGKRSAWLVVVGFAAIIFNFTIVNLFFKGLHVYSGLK